MGTSTTYGGSPKWKSVKGAVTRAAGAGPLMPQQAASTVRSFVSSMAASNTGGFGRPTGATGSRSGRGGGGAGGSGGGRTGRSRTSQAGGVRGAASSLGQFLQDVQRHGLNDALQALGCESVDALSPTDLVLLLATLLGGSDSTIDGVDLQNALCELLRDLTADASTLKDAETSLQSAAGGIEQVVRDLIGNYIAERYNTTMSARLDGKLSTTQTDASLGEVRRFIDTELQLKGAVKDLSNVDWKGTEGSSIVEELLQQTIAVFTEAS